MTASAPQTLSLTDSTDLEFQLDGRKTNLTAAVKVRFQRQLSHPDEPFFSTLVSLRVVPSEG
jgi:hypothetical protein